MCAARRRGLKVEMLGDLANSRKAKGTQALLARLKTARVDVRMRMGGPLSDHYTAAAPGSVIYSRNGIVHSKMLRADDSLVLGSLNWTTSSQCNVETCVEVGMTGQGASAVQDYFSSQFDAAEPY